MRGHFDYWRCYAAQAIFRSEFQRCGWDSSAVEIEHSNIHNICFEVSPSMKIKWHVCINVQMPRILHFAANIMSKVINLHRDGFPVFTFTLICNKQ